MSQTPSHVGREQTVYAMGRSWTLARWERYVWADFLEWAKTQLPDPAIAARDLLAVIPPEDEASRRQVVADAIKAKATYLSLNSPQVKELLDTLEGCVQLTYLLLKRHHPDATPDVAYDLVMAVGAEQMGRTLQACAGVVPKEQPPRGETQPGAATGETTPQPGPASTGH